MPAAAGLHSSKGASSGRASRSAFEAAAAAAQDPGLRYAARVCAESEGGLADPISSMLACEPQDGFHSVVWKARLLTGTVGDADDQADASLAVVESRSKGGAVSQRVEARNRQPEGALLPDKMVLTPPNSSINATESVPWAMLELWAALSLYHEDTPQIVSATTSLSVSLSLSRSLALSLALALALALSLSFAKQRPREALLNRRKRLCSAGRRHR